MRSSGRPMHHQPFDLKGCLGAFQVKSFFSLKSSIKEKAILVPEKLLPATNYRAHTASLPGAGPLFDSYRVIWNNGMKPARKPPADWHSDCHSAKLPLGLSCERESSVTARHTSSVVQLDALRYNRGMKAENTKVLSIENVIHELYKLESPVFKAFADACEIYDLRPNIVREVIVTALNNVREHGEPKIKEHLKLPVVAPELYCKRERSSITGKKENIVDFLKRVWGPWMDTDSITRSDLRVLDPSAERAVENWLLQRDLPTDVNLPTKKARNDRELAADPFAIMKSPRLAQVVASRLRKNRPVLEA